MVPSVITRRSNVPRSPMVFCPALSSASRPSRAAQLTRSWRGLGGAWEIGGMSSRARRRNSVWPPLHRRDLQRRSLPRIDPATCCAPTRPLERIRGAAAVCYLQRDVFIKRSGLDWIPAIVARRSHCTFPSSKRWPTICRVALRSDPGGDYQSPSRYRIRVGAMSGLMQDRRPRLRTGPSLIWLDFRRAVGYASPSTLEALRWRAAR
jgi:hypothetical protein